MKATVFLWQLHLMKKLPHLCKAWLGYFGLQAGATVVKTIIRANPGIECF